MVGIDNCSIQVHSQPRSVVGSRLTLLRVHQINRTNSVNDCAMIAAGLTARKTYKKLRYREEHSASVVLLGVLYGIYRRQSTDQQLINHFYVTVHESYRFRRNKANNGHYTVQGHSRSPILVPIESAYVTSY